MTQGDRDSSPLQRRLDQAIAEYLQAAEAGEPPDREAFVARYPDLAEHLRSFFAAQDHEQPSPGEPPTIASKDGRAAAETISLATGSAAGYAETLASPAPPFEAAGDRSAVGAVPGRKARYFGDYELLAEIAHGGMGVVYKARQVSLNRIVALKMILAGQLAGEEEVRRFYTEAEAAANLDHPGIVPIYEVGQHEGRHYYSMGFVEGQSLARKLAAGPLPPRQAAELVLKVAEAIAYAHQRGVIHRDLKPGNILLDRSGEPRVTDFGLAKHVGHVANVPDGSLETDGQVGNVPRRALTLTGQILGTPGYMPPEQAAGRSNEVGPLADVYALGAVLYAVLTARPPFQSESVIDTLRAVLEQEPVPPRQITSTIDRDLETICLKCLEKDPRSRYVSARELAEELRRYLDGEPILARPITRVERAARWVARHPARAAAYGFAVLTVGLLVLSVAFTWLWLNAETAHETAETARGQLASANAQLDDANRTLTSMNEKLDQRAYADQVLLAYNQFEAGNVAVAARLLAECKVEHRGWEWQHLNLKVHEHDLATLTGHTKGVGDVAYSPDGARLASASWDNTVRLWDGRNGKPLAILEGHTDAVDSLTFSPDGTRLASASWDKTVRLWDAHEGKPLATLTGHTHSVYHVAFSPDGTRLASASHDNTVRLWDARDGKPLAALAGHTAVVRHVIFSPDGADLVSASADHTIRLWRAEDGKPLGTLMGHTNEVRYLTYSPDGARLASVSDDETVRLWNARDRKLLATLRARTSLVAHVAFSPDGLRLASAGFDQSVRLWDAHDGKLLAVLAGHTAPVLHVAFSPDGTRLASASFDKTARLWDARDGKSVATLAAQAPARDVIFSRDGTRLAAAGWGHAVQLWDARDDKTLVAWPERRRKPAVPVMTPEDLTNQVAFSPDGARLAATSSDNTIRLWDAHDGKPLATLSGHTGWVSHVAFSPDSTRLASASADIRLWDARDGKPLAILAGVGQVVFNSDGTRLASAGGDAIVRIWDARDGRPLATLTGHSSAIRHIASSPDCTRLASADGNGGVRLWDAREFKLLAILPGHTGAVGNVTFSPDGTRLASSSSDNTIRLWDTSDGKALATLIGHQGTVMQAVFSGDGTRLASASMDNTVRLWDGRNGQPLAVLSGHGDWVWRVAFSPDGTQLASAGEDGTVRLYFSDETLQRREQRHSVWRQQQADEAAASGQWYAAAFHRTFLTGVMEGELLRVIGKTAGKTIVQEMDRFPAAHWSGDRQLLWGAVNPKDRLDLELPFTSAGRYALEAVLTKSQDFPIVQLWLDDRKLGEPIDLYQPKAADVTAAFDARPTDVVSFACGALTAGPHKLSVEIVGANAAAAPRTFGDSPNPGYMFGLDYVRLRLATK